MGSSKVQEIERAIGALTQQELEELKVWLDEYAGPQAIDKQLHKNIVAKRLDRAVKRALEDEKHGRVRPL